MNKVYLLIGGNLGDRLVNMLNAISHIENRCGRILEKSSIYETEAWGFTDQPHFYNQALLLETNLDAQNLMQQFIEIELALGRKREIPLGPRSVDIDIIYFNEDVISLANLNIPHPRMAQRNFVLAPLNEIAPQFIHPILKLSNAQLLIDSEDKSHVNKKNND
ncbi:MAG: 2-amino-4-hydroxy-6-hydroxymethyldihydropteridine diphosphokinase [Chitinophagia bacterium]|jgi:2-amino-4-hydroxy-6-hydroxymethyldihydropteridine diphosphokinase